MVRAVTAFRFRPHIERTAEIISATATVKNPQCWDLSCEFGLPFLQKEFLKLLDQRWQYLGQQWRVARTRHGLPYSLKVSVVGFEKAPFPKPSIQMPQLNR